MNDATTFAKPGIGSYNFGLSFIVKSIFDLLLPLPTNIRLPSGMKRNLM